MAKKTKAEAKPNTLGRLGIDQNLLLVNGILVNDQLCEKLVNVGMLAVYDGKDEKVPTYKTDKATYFRPRLVDVATALMSWGFSINIYRNFATYKFDGAIVSPILRVQMATFKDYEFPVQAIEAAVNFILSDERAIEAINNIQLRGEQYIEFLKESLRKPKVKPTEPEVPTTPTKRVRTRKVK
jgi:hypothetical protein